MSRFWEVFEEMKEIVYVTDIETDELVYINRFGRETFGLNDPTDFLGKPCYKTLQGLSSHCSFCTNSKLKAGEFYEWKYHNAALNKTFYLKDTLIEQDGRRYRMEISIDINEMEEQSHTIECFSSNETMVNEALRLAFNEDGPDKGIRVILQYLGRSLKSDRVYIFEGKMGENTNNTYEWCAEGVEPQIDSLQDLPFELVAPWFEHFSKGENIIITELESIKESDPWIYDTLLIQQINSLVVSPIILKGEIIGYYGVDNPPKELLKNISIMFLVLGYFIAALIKNRNVRDKLEALSYHDQMTGAKNRHGMNAFVESIAPDSSVGLVYCDVMGLKHINDTKGHIEGDALLIRAYECMCSAFPKESIFRIGGDEFLAMKSDVTEDDMRERVVKLRSLMGDYDVKFAVGEIWVEKYDGKFDSLLMQADARMYADKAEYYSRHGNDRRAR